MYRIFVINPGSTSTKIALFEDRNGVWERKIFHEAEDLSSFGSVNDQLDYRFGLIRRALEEDGIDLSGIDAIAARGGSCCTVESGVYLVNDRMIEDTRLAKGGAEHASMLGVQLADRFREIYGGAIFTMDPIVVDEYSELARMTGIRGLYRSVSSHALNQKGVAMEYARSIGKRYEELDLIVAHIDGGITVGAHEKGRMTDCNSGAGGDGPYTPSRIGSIGVADLIHYAKDMDSGELERLCNTGGGFSSLLGTNDADRAWEMVRNGDKAAYRAWYGMIYQICKQIGAMASVLCGCVDAILLTGGLVRFRSITDEIERRCGWIAPVRVFPGEVEMQALAHGALRVLTGQQQAKEYTGEPVFSAFPEDV